LVKEQRSLIYGSVQYFNRLLANKEEGYAFYIGRRQVEFSRTVKNGKIQSISFTFL